MDWSSTEYMPHGRKDFILFHVVPQVWEPYTEYWHLLVAEYSIDDY